MYNKKGLAEYFICILGIPLDTSSETIKERSNEHSLQNMHRKCIIHRSWFPIPFQLSPVRIRTVNKTESCLFKYSERTSVFVFLVTLRIFSLINRILGFIFGQTSQLFPTPHRKFRKFGLLSNRSDHSDNSTK